MPRIKLTKSTIDALPIERKDIIYGDRGYPGFGVKITPRGRKVFLALYRTADGASKLRKFTIGPYGKVTLHRARTAVQRVFTAKLEGRDPAGEKREARMREVTDRVADLLNTYFAQRLAGNRSGAEIARLLQRELISVWGNKSIHDIAPYITDTISWLERWGAHVASIASNTQGAPATRPPRLQTLNGSVAA